MKMQFFRSLHLLPCLCMMYLYLGLAAGETIDEVIASSSTAVTDIDLLSDIAGSELLVDLDMILTMEQYSLLYGNTNTANNAKSSPRKKRKALQSLTGRWSKKEIPYNIQTATFTLENLPKFTKQLMNGKATLAFVSERLLVLI
uniref:Uncharacterized protein n=1 Tax=Arion vulgaris TaxID=1028688 RepID=A0A0B7BPZ9_9EUPU